MRRRDFVQLLGSATVAWPLASAAQTPSVRRVGVLMANLKTAHALDLKVPKTVLLRFDRVIE